MLDYQIILNVRISIYGHIVFKIQKNLLEKNKYYISEDKIDKFYEYNENINVHGGRSNALKILKDIKNLKEPILKDIINIIDKYFNKYFKIDKDELILNLEKKIYFDLIKKEKIKYDINDDIVNGISKDSINLPKYDISVEKIRNILKVDLTKLTESGEYEEKESVRKKLKEERLPE